MNALANNWKNLKEAEKRVFNRLVGRPPIHEIHFVPHGGTLLEIYIFYPTDKDAIENEGTVLTEHVKNIFNEALSSVERGEVVGEDVRYEFDSHDNVLKNYQGNYFLRLR